MASTRTLVLSAIFAASILLAVGCEHADPLTADPSAPTLTSIQNTIFNSSCAVSGCHLGGTSPLGLDLSPGSSWSNLVNVASAQQPGIRRVAPGDPDNSYLVMKLEGAAGITGQRMPRGRDPLTATQIETIREWIQAGALDD